MKNEYASIHKALMPLSLAERVITMFTNENDLVVDPFSGLATTMFACIRTNRKYFGIELEPLYCQETIRRYLSFTFKPNIKIIKKDNILDYKDFKEQLNYKAEVIDGKLEMKKSNATKISIFDFE